MNKKENKYFELLENVTICYNIQAWKTAEGFYLTQNDEALQLQKATDDIKVIDNLILAEMDYHSINLLQTITMLTRQTNEKICQVYKTIINMYKKIDNEFFIFNDFNGNEAVLYTDQGQIFVPNCIQISKIEIIEKTERCYEDFPALIKINNQSIAVFLTNDLILKQTGTLRSCENNKHNLHLPRLKRILSKNGQNTFLEDESKFIHLRFNLQESNLTQINFKHDETIINSINLIKQIANVTTIFEPMGAWHILNDIRSEQLLQKDQINNNSTSIFTKIIIFVGICIIVVLIMQLIKLSCSMLIKYRSTVMENKSIAVRDIIKLHPQNVQNIL
jgi:hypothetical protein